VFTVGDVGLHLGSCERHHLGVLRGDQRGPQPLQQRDPVDPRSVVDIVSNGGLGGEGAEPGEHHTQLGDDLIRGLGRGLGPALAHQVRSHVRNLAPTPDSSAHIHRPRLEHIRCPEV
jgi:hypothetical protein